MGEVRPARWFSRIRSSLELQKHRRDEAARFMRGYAGDYGVKPKKGIDDGSKDEMSVNFVYSYVETVGPTVMPGTPRCFVEAAVPEAEDGAPYAQAVVNHWVRTLGLKREFKKCLNDWFYGHCGFLTEWEYEEELLWVPNRRKKEPLIDPSTGQQQFEVIWDRPVARRLDPWDIILDRDAKSREEDRYRIVRVIMTKSEFNLLPGVGSDMKKRIKGRALPPELQRQPVGTSRDQSPDRNFVILYRIYDLENETVKLLPEGDNVRDFVELIDWPWQMDVGGDRWPVTILEAKPDADNPYSFSAFKAFWMQIQERNKLRTMLQSTARRSAPGWLMKKGAMDEEQKNAFVEAKIGEITEANKPEGIVPRPLPNMSKEFFQHDASVDKDLLDVSGLYEYTELNAETATEASIQNNRSSIRKGSQKEQFSDFTAVIYGKLLQLSQQYMTIPAMVKIKHPDNPGQIQWMKANRGHIQGEMSLTCKPGISDYEDEGLRRQQDLKYAELMANNQHVDQRKLAERISRRFDIEPDEILKPAAQVQQEQQQQQAAEAAKNAKPPPRPDLTFAPIPPELVAQVSPQELSMFLATALHQNGVPAPAGVGNPTGVPPLGTGIAPGAASPSMAGPAGPQNQVMPPPGINQAPAPPGGGMPPPTPVQPASEMQGGKT
jgi:hypothetical protein